MLNIGQLSWLILQWESGPYRNNRMNSSSQMKSHLFGEVLGTLDRLELTENTLVIFVGDNGGLLDPASSTEQRGAGYGDGTEAPQAPDFSHRANGPGLRGAQGDIREGGHRIPFQARRPQKIRPDTSSGDTTSLTDMVAAFAALAGRELTDDAGPDSFNVLPTLLGGKFDDSLDHPRVMESGSISGMLAIRDGLRKLIDGQPGGGYRDGKAEPGEALQLYDLSHDLGEESDACAQQPDLAKRLRQCLHKIKAEGRSR